MASLLAELSTLEELYLDDNEIGTDGAVALVSSWKAASAMKQLKVLSLGTCDLTARGAYYIARYEGLIIIIVVIINMSVICCYYLCC